MKFIGMYIKSETVKMRSWTVSITLKESNLSLIKKILTAHKVRTFKIEQNNSKGFETDTMVLKFLEQYPASNKEREAIFHSIGYELYDLIEDYKVENNHYRKFDEFEGIDTGERYTYLIFDQKSEADIREIISHYLKIDIKVYQVNTTSKKYDINGLIYLKINDYRIATHKYTSDEILGVFATCKIPHCIYTDMNGKVMFDIRINNKDSRQSSVKFRKDLGLVLRSSWEANIARLFKYLGINFEYEKHHFLLEKGDSSQTYIPDFFLEGNIIVEVKGFWDAESLKKVWLLKEQHKDYTLLTLDADMYLNLDKEYRNRVPEWEQVHVSLGKERVPVVGITRPERKKFVNKVQVGEELRLKRDLENDYDRNAIIITNLSGDTIGYMAKEWAAVYSDKLDIGMTFRAVVETKEEKIIMLKLSRTNLDELTIYDFIKLVN